MRSLGRMLLNSNVIYIHLRVVMLVRMIHTRLFAAARVKSCPGMRSSCAIASFSKPKTSLLLWLCSHNWPSSKIRGVAQELIKGNHWPLTQARKSRLGLNGTLPCVLGR